MKKAIIISIKGDNESQAIIDVRKQLVSSLKGEYNVIFLNDDVDLDDINFKVISESKDEDPIVKSNEEWDESLDDADNQYNKWSNDD